LQLVRTDVGVEFASRPYIAWAQAHRLRHRLIELGKPMQSGYIEGYFGKVLAQRELVPDLGSDSYPRHCRGAPSLSPGDDLVIPTDH
jgi:transposase InsO family protein